MHGSTTIKLINGVEIPRVGLGTFKARGEEVSNAVTLALSYGIRHIDTAAIYKVGHHEEGA
jgi:diketogulonate reductase-like aldo/keto reductase